MGGCPFGDGVEGLGGGGGGVKIVQLRKRVGKVQPPGIRPAAGLSLFWELYKSSGHLDRSKNGQPNPSSVYLRSRVNLDWVHHF